MHKKTAPDIQYRALSAIAALTKPTHAIRLPERLFRPKTARWHASVPSNMPIPRISPC